MGGNGIVQFLGKKLVPLMHAFFFSVSMLLLPQYGCYISAFVFRLQSLEKNIEKETEFLEAEPEILSEREAEEDVAEFGGLNSEDIEEEEKFEEYLKFKFPDFEEFSRNLEKTGDLIGTDEITSGTGRSSNVREYVNELKTLVVEEIKGNENREEESEQIRNEVDESRGVSVSDEEEERKDNIEEMKFTVKSEEKEHSIQEDEKFHGNQDFIGESQHSSEKNSVVNDSDSSLNFEHFGAVINGFVDSYRHDFSSDEDYVEIESKNVQFQQSFNEWEKEMETGAILTEQDFDRLTEEENPDAFINSETDYNATGFHTKYESNSEKTQSNGSDIRDDPNKLESLWEHQDLIDQLNMELRKVRAGAVLPTIFEESESPKIMDDLKPWKIDEKLHREDRMGDLHKVHTSYRKRMRKFDILNYQKMYAMGFVQLKADLPVQPNSEKKPSMPTLKSLVSQKHDKAAQGMRPEAHVSKLMDELQGDIEVVYVGQLCLSWEILHWQYEKVVDLWDSDPRGIHRYNEVAGDFQQFQVLMQRFIEEEQFQGPRVQNYIKNRCVLRNLLQVPVIRADNMRDKKWRSSKDRDHEYVITSEVLVEIVQESIRIFWRFVKADKDCVKNKMPQLSDPEDLKLLLVLRKDLQKKERKLKDVLRSENCILRRFRLRGRGDSEGDDDEWDQVLSFFCQVDLRLVSRVLKMSRITREQLMWCHDKLERISFVNRKMCIQHSFLLFPCS